MSVTRRQILGGGAATMIASGLGARASWAALRVPAYPFDHELPSSADVVIIGGGIIGVTTALFLAQRGISVVVCEKGFVGGEQSGRALGWVRVMGRDVRDIPLSLESRKLWAGLDEAIGGATGYRPSGIVYVAGSDKGLAGYEAWLKGAKELGVDSRIITAAETKALIPATGGAIAGAMYTPGDGCAEPTLAAPAIARGARANGAKVVTFCAARGFETKAGRVSAVITEKGVIACQSVLLAGGIWSGLFCGNQNIDLPLLPVGSYVMRTTPLEGPDICVRNGFNGIRRNLDGGYTVGSPQGLADITPETFKRFFQFLPALRSRWETTELKLGRGFIENWKLPRRWAFDVDSPFERDRVHDPGPAPWAAKVWEEGARLYPFLKQAAIAEQWGGLLDVTPDSLPVISPIEAVPGLFVAAGFSGGGFGTGPGAAKLAADLVTGASPSIEPRPYRYSRFFDGSVLAIAD